jgi:hypothetical protein
MDKPASNYDQPVTSGQAASPWRISMVPCQAGIPARVAQGTVAKKLTRRIDSGLFSKK